MSTFVKSPEFQQLKPIGVALDEGKHTLTYTHTYIERACHTHSTPNRNCTPCSPLTPYTLNHLLLLQGLLILRTSILYSMGKG